MSVSFINTDYNTESLENQDKRKILLEKISERQKYKMQLYENIKSHLSENQKAYYKNCGKFLRVNEKGNITQAYLCRNRFCPVCNMLNSRGKYAKIINAMKEFPPCEFIFITLTVKNVVGQDLKKELEHISRSFHKFQNRAPMNKVSMGYFRTTEITYNAEKDTFHPHIHMLVSVSPEYFKSNEYSTTFEWRTAWESSAQLDYVSQVDVKKVEKGDNIFHAVAEISKYCTKLSSIISNKQNEKAIGHLIKATKNRRLINVGGLFKKLKDIENEYITEIDDENAKNYIYTNNQYIGFDGFI